DDCNRKTRLCVGSAKTRLMATDETEKQQKQNPEPFRVGSVSDFSIHDPYSVLSQNTNRARQGSKRQCVEIHQRSSYN
ncbi:MAG: hypothetical protein QW177_09580, partial [Candidatus Nitrosotenuis sp.]